MELIPHVPHLTQV